MRVIYFGLAIAFSLASFAAVEKKATVITLAAKKESFSDRVQYPARVRSKINAWVLAESAGEVKKIIRAIGSPVKRGDALMVVQNTDPIYRYAPVTVTAPANGYVTSLEVDLLAHVERGQKLVLVTDPNQIVIETEIPAADLQYFRIGQGAQFKDQTGQVYQAKIRALSPVVDVKTGTGSAEIEINQGQQNQGQPLLLPPGQIGQVIFDVHQRQSFVVPESAVVYREGKPFVRILENGQAKRIPIQIALNLGDKIELASGLTEGQVVITRWSRFIADNEDVDIQKKDDSESTTEAKTK